MRHCYFMENKQIFFVRVRITRWATKYWNQFFRDYFEIFEKFWWKSLEFGKLLNVVKKFKYFLSRQNICKLGVPKKFWVSERLNAKFSKKIFSKKLLKFGVTEFLNKFNFLNQIRQLNKIFQFPKHYPTYITFNFVWK